MDYEKENDVLTTENEEELFHYGMPRRSGRYPWGSGDDPYQHGSGDLISRVDELKKSGMSESDIAKTLGVLNDKGQPSSTKLRTMLSMAKEDRRALDVATARSLREDGLSLNQIAEKMGFANDSSVRSLLDAGTEVRMNQAKQLAADLKKLVDERGMIDVGSGVERELNCSKEKLEQALYRLELEGYPHYSGRVPQVNNPGKQTTVKVLCPPGYQHKDIYNYGDVKSVKDYISRDGGQTLEKKFHYPASLDSKRLKILLADEIGPDGEPGVAKDGIIQLRRGVEDLSLGESRYSQVRILVDGTHYLKGMAVYSDNMPDGIDVVFNSNKTSYDKALKKIKDDPDNPFGSAIKDANQGGQYWYTDSKTGEKKLGLINKRADEGDWSDWADTVPSQFLSKQPLSLAKRQIKIAVENREAEYDSICSLTNPTVKKKLLEEFATSCDSAAVHLKAAALPRQKYHVILPFNGLKENEIYAPKYANGEQVALIRYPHGGTFEIPILTVNNKHAAAKKILGTDIEDAVGINKAVAERLSGADFDGDTVMVIPTNDKVKIKSTPQLKGLEGFDPQTAYRTEEINGKYYNSKGVEIKVMRNTQNEMGRISNLITDMTLQNATQDELARAVRHSMVVIDAEKHKLDYKSSYEDNGIAALKKEYQTGGASTLISRAKSQQPVLKRQGSPKVNMKGDPDYDPTKPEGALIYKTADPKLLYKPVYSDNKTTGVRTYTTIDGEKIKFKLSDKEASDKYKAIKQVQPDGSVKYTNKDGTIEYKIVARTQKSTRMAEETDAYNLISEANTPMERLYADYANKMKAMANDARKEMKTTGKIEYKASAKEAYLQEYNSLMSKLNTSEKNHPRERQAQLIANSEMKAKKAANPDMTKEEEKKYSQQALNKARITVGAKREQIVITDREWEAIQAGAISENVLTKILNNTDTDRIRQLATPRTTSTLNAAKISRAKSMSARGYTLQEIANQLGVSTTTVAKALKGKE